jgi:diguanylate cyclase (GGDEF)-like protein/PAS domain S-box-containing protein
VALGAHIVIVATSTELREQRVSWAAATLLFVIAVVVRLRRNRDIEREPWVLLAVGAFVGLVASIGYSFPSYNDLISYSSYITLMFAMRSFQHRRNTERDPDGALDALIVAAATAVLVFAAILSHYLRDSAIPPLERAGNLGYSLMTISLVGLTARLAVGAGTRNRSWYLLAMTVTAVVVNDLLILLDTAGAEWGFTLSTWIAPLAPIFCTAAILHPTAADLTRNPGVAPTKLTRGRLVMLGGALLIIPGVLFTSRLRGQAPDYAVLTAGSVALALLSLARLTRLFRAQEAATETEAVLREAGAHLLASPSASAILEAASATATKIVGKDEDTTVMMVSARPSSENPAAEYVYRLPGAVLEPVELSDLFDGETQVFLQRNDVLHLWPHIKSPRVVVTALDDPRHPVGAILVESNRPLAKRARQSLIGLASQVALALRNAELTTKLAGERVERRFRSLIETSSDIVAILDEHGNVRFISPAITHLLGISERDAIGKPFAALAHPEDARLIERILNWTRGTETFSPIEVRLKGATTSADSHWFEVTTRDLRLDPEVAGFVLNARKITDRKIAEDRLGRSEARFRALVQHSSDVVLVADASAIIQYVSPSITVALGYRPDELVGNSVMELLPRESIEELRPLLDLMASSFNKFEFETKVIGADREVRSLVVTASDLRAEPAVNGIVFNARDVTLHRSLEEDLARRSNEDDVTGLPNRSRLVDLLDATLALGDPNDVAVLVLGIDDYETITDGIGPSGGEQALRVFASRLRNALRTADVVARVGSDEFAILMHVASDDELTAASARLAAIVSEPVHVDGRSVVTTASVGAALGSSGASAEEILRNADTALHVAKRQGKARSAVFEPSMRADASERFQIITDLRRGIQKGELVDLYQPKMTLKTERIAGAEALVRWAHPSRGVLGPGSFVPLAEENGLIVELGQWVFDHAVTRLLRWNEQLGEERAISISINLSARQLEQPDAIDGLMDAAKRIGIDPSLVVLELTESIFVGDVGPQRAELDRLWRFGFRISVDDFGTGYSSLRYLEQLPIHEIKIDRSFVDGIDRSQTKQSVTARIVELASDLGLTTVAEGIEGAAELEIVRRLGCDYGQGYYFSQPVNAATFESLLGLRATSSTNRRRALPAKS